MKKIGDSTSDMISDLPGVILENILICMPLRDAVRTSVLSTRWRYKWTLIPQLVFEDNIISLRKAASQFDPFLPRQDRVINRELLLIISQVLMLHRAPILKFTLSISKLESCPEIDNLITFLTNNGIEELTLQFWKGLTTQYYKLPSSLFSFQKLTHLSLRGCIFRPPTKFEGFSRLVCLEFNRVAITRESFARLISSCSMLEQLKVETLGTCGVPLEIDSHSLKISNFLGDFKSIRYKNAPRLAIVSLLSNAYARDETSVGDSFGWFDFFTNLPVLETLEMDEYYVKSLAISTVARTLGRLPIANTLGRLKILKLHDICLDSIGVIRIVLCLMVSPKMQKVTIKVKYSGENVKARQYLQRCGTFGLNQLREVELGITSGTYVELELMKLILARSRALEKMVLKPEPGRVNDGGLKILRESAVFERLSPKAKVTYKDPDVL